MEYALGPDDGGDIELLPFTYELITEIYDFLDSLLPSPETTVEEPNFDEPYLKPNVMIAEREVIVPKIKRAERLHTNKTMGNPYQI